MERPWVPTSCVPLLDGVAPRHSSLPARRGRLLEFLPSPLLLLKVAAWADLLALSLQPFPASFPRFRAVVPPHLSPRWHLADLWLLCCPACSCRRGNPQRELCFPRPRAPSEPPDSDCLKSSASPALLPSRTARRRLRNRMSSRDCAQVRPGRC